MSYTAVVVVFGLNISRLGRSVISLLYLNKQMLFLLELFLLSFNTTTIIISSTTFCFRCPWNSWELSVAFDFLAGKCHFRITWSTAHANCACEYNGRHRKLLFRSFGFLWKVSYQYVYNNKSLQHVFVCLFVYFFLFLKKEELLIVPNVCLRIETFSFIAR